MLSLACNLGLLGSFKYFNFLSESFALLANSLHWHVDDLTLKVVLPVGISFYTFQTLSYTIDIYRGRVAPTRSLLDYLAIGSFFPQLVAGPIERARSLLPQFRDPRKFDDAQACGGGRAGSHVGLLPENGRRRQPWANRRTDFCDTGGSRGPDAFVGGVSVFLAGLFRLRGALRHRHRDGSFSRFFRGS
jgi:hypothetical protein